jgi:hypothetical protein
MQATVKIEPQESEFVAHRRVLWTISDSDIIAKNGKKQFLDAQIKIDFSGKNKTTWQLTYYTHLETDQRPSLFCGLEKRTGNSEGIVVYLMATAMIKSSERIVNCDEVVLCFSSKSRNDSETSAAKKSLQITGIHDSKSIRVQCDILAIRWGALQPKLCQCPHLLLDYVIDCSFSDFEIICKTISGDYVNYPAHRNILSARSKVFKNMLTTETAQKTLYCAEIDSETMLLLLKFIYSGSANVKGYEKELLQASEQFELPVLRRICLHSIIGSLQSRNIVDTLELALRYNDHELEKACIAFLSAYVQF